MDLKEVADKSKSTADKNTGGETYGENIPKSDSYKSQIITDKKRDSGYKISYKSRKFKVFIFLAILFFFFVALGTAWFSGFFRRTEYRKTAEQPTYGFINYINNVET